MKILKFLFGIVTYYLLFGGLKIMIEENYTVLRPVTIEDYILSAFLLAISVIVAKYELFPDNSEEETRERGSVERIAVWCICGVIEALRIYVGLGVLQFLFGFGETILHPFREGNYLLKTGILFLSVLGAIALVYINVKRNPD